MFNPIIQEQAAKLQLLNQLNMNNNLNQNL